MSESRVIFTLVERIWHWVQAVSMVILALSGISMHWPDYSIFSTLKSASNIHHIFGYVVTVNFVIWLIYMIATKRIKQYMPQKHDEYPMGIFKQAKYYLFEIYTKKEHPYPVSPERRLNPMQKLAYIQVMFLAMPAQMITGFILMGSGTSMKMALIIHGVLALFFVLFIVGHIYLATTGHTPLAYFKEMITGKFEDH